MLTICRAMSTTVKDCTVANHAGSVGFSGEEFFPPMVMVCPIVRVWSRAICSAKIVGMWGVGVTNTFGCELLLSTYSGGWAAGIVNINERQQDINWCL